MARFTAPVPLNIRLPGGFEVVGAVGATHRIPDELVEEFTRDQVPTIPGGVTWITQDESTAVPTLPISQANVSGLTAALAAKAALAGATFTGPVDAPDIAGVIYADQYSSLQAAHDALPATGGTIFIPAGTYTSPVGSPAIQISKNGVRIVGAGRGATVLKYPNNSTNKYLINATAAITDLYIGHLEIDGNGVSQTAIDMEGIRIVGPGTRRVTAEDIYIHDIKGSVSDESLAINFGNTTASVMRGIYARNNGGSGICISGSNDVVISDCVAEGNGWMGFTVSVNTVPSINVTMSNCIAINNVLFGFNFESVHYATLAGLVSKGNGDYGIVFNEAGGIAYSHHIGGAGIISISNGTSTTGGRYGILFAGNSATGANNINLTGVVATDTQSVKTQTYGAVSGGLSSNCSVSGDLRGNLTGEADLTTNGTNNTYRPSRPIRVRLWNSANIAINNNSSSPVTFNTETTDIEGFHSLVSATERIVIPAGLAGQYRFGAIISMATQTTSVCGVSILKNGATVVASATDGIVSVNNRPINVASGPLDCVAGDIFEVRVHHFGGATVNVLTQADYSPVFWAERV